jgi:pimeloyl-ACP methyl ester carboxylesterase
MLLTLVRLAGLALFFYGLLLFAMQRRIAFPGMSRQSPRPAASAPAGVTQLWLTASFGRVEAWFVPASAVGTAPTVVFAHGNGELIEDWREAMDELARAGVNALLVEFPGYGYSEGRPTRATIRETFGLAYDWLASQERVDLARIVAYGRSIGGGAASDLARDRPVGALVLQSTFVSTMRMAREILAPGFLVRDRWDNARGVYEFGGPVLVMHGRADEVIAFSHAEAVVRARPGLAVTEIPCGHNDCLDAWPAIVDTLTAFLRTNGLLDDGSGSVAGA